MYTQLDLRCINLNFALQCDQHVDTFGIYNNYKDCHKVGHLWSPEDESYSYPLPLNLEVNIYDFESNVSTIIGWITITFENF